MQDHDQTETTELTLAQLMSNAGIASAIARPDETSKMPGQIEGMIAAAGRQLEAVTTSISSLDELSRRVAAARSDKIEEKDRIEKTLNGLIDAQAAMSKP